MVENFTTVNENTCDHLINEELETIEEQEFEENIRKSIQYFVKSPTKDTIENILNYSKSISK